MPDAPQHVRRNTALDPHLLSTPFGVQTNWRVIAGAPSSGKTTVIDLLAGRGFRTVAEGARQYIEGEMARGRAIHPILEDGAALQRAVARVQLGIEAGLPPEDPAFLDGALPVSLAWYRAFGLDPNELLPACFRHRYACVFLLDPLPFRPDGQRPAQVASLAGFLDGWLARDFRALGYDAVRVPALAPEARLAFVLERL